MTMLWCWEMERLLLKVFVCGLPDDSCSPLPAHISASKTASSISRATAHCCYYIKSRNQAARLQNRFATKSTAAALKTLSIVQIIACKPPLCAGVQVRTLGKQRGRRRRAHDDQPPVNCSLSWPNALLRDRAILGRAFWSFFTLWNSKHHVKDEAFVSDFGE